MAMAATGEGGTGLEKVQKLNLTPYYYILIIILCRI